MQAVVILGSCIAAIALMAAAMLLNGRAQTVAIAAAFGFGILAVTAYPIS